MSEAWAALWRYRVKPDLDYLVAALGRAGEAFWIGVQTSRPVRALARVLDRALAV